MHRIFDLEILLLGNYPTDITYMHMCYIIPTAFSVIAKDEKQSNTHQCAAG